MSKTFEEWFKHYLLKRTDSCLDRDIFRWAKPILELGYKYQSLSDLEFKGSQELIDAWIKSKTYRQRAGLKGRCAMLKVFRENKVLLDECREENRKLREVVEFYANKDNWEMVSHNYSAPIINDDDLEESCKPLVWGDNNEKTTNFDCGGKRARQLLDQLNKDKK